MVETEREREAREQVEAWLKQPAWVLADLRRRLKLRARARELHALIHEGKL